MTDHRKPYLTVKIVDTREGKQHKAPLQVKYALSYDSEDGEADYFVEIEVGEECHYTQMSEQCRRDTTTPGRITPF